MIATKWSKVIWVFASLSMAIPANGQPIPPSPEVSSIPTILARMQVLEIITEAQLEGAEAAYRACDFIAGDAWHDAYDIDSRKLEDMYGGIQLLGVSDPVITARIANTQPYLKNRRTHLDTAHDEARIDCFLASMSTHTDDEAIEVAELLYRQALGYRLLCHKLSLTGFRGRYLLSQEELNTVATDLIGRSAKATTDANRKKLDDAIDKVGERLLEMPAPENINSENCVPRELDGSENENTEDGG